MEGGGELSGVGHATSKDVVVRDQDGLHARPVMRFVDSASRFSAKVWVENTTLRGERVDGKSAMQMMLLEATRGSVLRITAEGPDAAEAVQALCALVERGFDTGAVA